MTGRGASSQPRLCRLPELKSAMLADGRGRQPDLGADPTSAPWNCNRSNPPNLSVLPLLPGSLPSTPKAVRIGRGAYGHVPSTPTKQST